MDKSSPGPIGRDASRRAFGTFDMSTGHRLERRRGDRFIASALVFSDSSEVERRIVGKKEHAPLGGERLEHRCFLIDHQLGESIITHGDGEMDPGRTGDEVGRKDQAILDHLEMNEPGGMPVGQTKAIGMAQGMIVRGADEVEASTGLEQTLQLGDERCPIPGMGPAGPLESLPTDDIGGLGKEQRGRPPFLPGAEQPAGMIKMEMRENHMRDIVRRKAGAFQVRKQKMLGTLDPETPAQLGLHERADARFGQDQSRTILDEKCSTGQLDAIVVIGPVPAAPEGSWTVTEHGSAVEFLGVPEDTVVFHENPSAFESRIDDPGGG